MSRSFVRWSEGGGRREVVGGRADGWCSGAWIVFPSYMVYVFGREILQGLAVASGTAGSEEDDIARKER